MTSVLETRRRLKADLERYRAAARARYPGVTVRDHAPVVPCADGGAFVEATIWVPEEEIHGE